MAAPFDWSQYQPTIVKLDLQTTVDSTSGGVALGTAAQMAGKCGAIVTVETASIRVTEDGIAADAPTTTFGTLYNAGDRFVVWGTKNVQNFRAIRTTGTSATLDIQFLTFS